MALLNRAPISHHAEHSGLMCFLLNRTIQECPAAAAATTTLPAAAAETTTLPAAAAAEAELQQTGTNNNCSVHRKPSSQQCTCINVPFFRFLGTGIMGHWNGDTKNKHTSKQQQWCAAATCTHLQNPHQNHPFRVPSQSCQAEVQREKGTGRMGCWNGHTDH